MPGMPGTPGAPGTPGNARHTRRARHTRQRQAHQATPGTPCTVAGAGGPPAPAGIAVAAPTVTAPAAEVDGHKSTQTQQPAQPYTKNMTAPPAAVDGHTAPPDPAAEAVIPAMPPIATGKRILTGSKTPGKTLQIRRKCGENRPTCKRRDSRRRFRNPRRLRGKRLNTHLGFTSGQPSWLHRLQAGRSQVSPA